MNRRADTEYLILDTRGKLGASVWACGLILCIVFLSFRFHRGLNFDTSILSLLPTSQQSPLEEKAYQILSNRFSNQLVFLLGGEIDGDPANQDSAGNLLKASATFTQSLQSSGHFSKVYDSFDNKIKSQIDFYLPYKDLVLSAESRQRLNKSSSADLFQEALIQVYNPITRARVSSLVEDPLNLFSQWLQKDASASALKTDVNGLLVNQASKQYRFISASFLGDAFHASKQRQSLKAIQLAEQQLLQAHPQWELLRSGLLFHSAAAEQQAKQELSTIGLGSLVGIVLLILLYFRSAAPLFLTLLALGSGILFALSLCLFIFDRVHIITLAFGASLVGVAIDYALHFLVARQYYRSSTLKLIMPGIRLALFSSIVAYGAQALTPFPGLQQMALFSAAGLTGAWLSVVLFFPLIGDGQKHSGRDTATKRRNFLSLGRHSVILFFLISFVFIGLGAKKLQFDDDIRLLQNSPPGLMQQELQLQNLVMNPSAGQFFLVNASSIELLLQIEEDLSVDLNSLRTHKVISSYQSLSQQVPSLRQQQNNKQLLADRVYASRQLDNFFTSLGAPGDTAVNARDKFFKPSPKLELDAWLASEASEFSSHLWLGDSSTASIISLGGIDGESAILKLEALAERKPGVQFVDRPDNISTLLGHYRQQITLWILLAYLMVFVLLWCRYQHQALMIISAPLLATLISFSMLSMADIPLNLFHVLAALLVLGIGLDMGIFLNENQYQYHAQAAVGLSATTTLLAFGLLSLSRTPVLFSFGITVLPGIALSWLIASTFLPILFPPNKDINIQRIDTHDHD